MTFQIDSSDELMYIVDALKILKTSYSNIRGVHPDEHNYAVEVINGLIKRIDPLVPNYNDDED